MMKKNALKNMKVVALGILIALATGCGKGEQKTSVPDAAKLATEEVTLDAQRQDIYETNCQVCHGMAGTGAPVSGQAADWHERVAMGMDTMLDHAMDGFQAMPPMGGCFDCTEEDFRQLITFMTSGMLK